MTVIDRSGIGSTGCTSGRNRPRAKWRRKGDLFTLAVLCVVSGGWAAALPGADPIWVALVEADGALTPIARYQEGVWDWPWPPPFRPELRVDSAGVLRPQLMVQWDLGQEPWALPVEVAESRDVRLTAPLTWQLYAETESKGALAVRYLRLQRVQCLHEWVLETDRRDLPELDVPTHRKLAGVAFSRPVAAVPEADIPGLDRMREQLGYVDEPGDKAPRYVWLGFYRVNDGAVIGVMNIVGYEGEAFDVVEIVGEVGTVVARAFGGSC